MPDEIERPEPPRSLRLPIIAILGIAAGAAGILGIQYFSKPSAPLNPPPGVSAEQIISESDFQSAVLKTFPEGEVMSEWRAARGDHQIVALSIATCAGLGDSDSMPRNVFSSLRLDLQPNGSHFIGAQTSSTPGAKEQNAAVPQPRKPSSLVGDQMTMVVLSDAAARARIAAADGAASNYEGVKIFGWYTVLISGLATLFITLKSSMNPRRVRQPDEAIRWGDVDTYRNAAIGFLGIAAIILSTAGTVLTGVKQFYEPTAAYARNTAALVKARQLHQDIILAFINSFSAFSCTSANPNPEQIKGWAQTMSDLQQQILKSAIPVPGLDGGSPKGGTPANGAGQQQVATAQQQAPVISNAADPGRGTLPPPSATPPPTNSPPAPQPPGKR